MVSEYCKGSNIRWEINFVVNFQLEYQWIQRDEIKCQQNFIWFKNNKIVTQQKYVPQSTVYSKTVQVIWL